MQNIPGLADALASFNNDTIEQAEIQIKYERYIEKEQEIATRMSQMENTQIPDSFDYDRVSALSNEALQKFKRIRPRTLGQASRISGVNPSDVQILMVYMGRWYWIVGQATNKGKWRESDWCANIDGIYG